MCAPRPDLNPGVLGKGLRASDIISVFCAPSSFFFLLLLIVFQDEVKTRFHLHVSKHF